MYEIPDSHYNAIAGRLVYERGFLTDLLANPRHELKDALIQTGINPSPGELDALVANLDAFFDEYGLHQVTSAASGYLREGDNAEMI